jgi:hypothetical protein
MIKMDLKMKNSKVEHMVEMMRCGPPLENLIERRVVNKISEEEDILYLKIKMPGFMSTRDNLVKKTMSKMPDGATLLTIKSTGGDEVPEQAGVVRIEMFKTQQYRQDPENPEDLLITDFTTMDMKGYFPMRIMNMMLGTMMPKSVAKMSETLEKVKNNGGKLPTELET